MSATQGTVQALEHARVALALIAVSIAVFWRTALRVLFAIIVVAVGAGAYMLFQGMQR